MARDPYQYFRIEARELLEGLGQGVLELEKGGAGKELVGQLLRLAHTLKGAARVVRQLGIADAAHAVEDVLSPHRETGGPAPRERIDELLLLLDTIKAQVAALDQAPPDRAPEGPPPPAAAEDLQAEARSPAGSNREARSPAGSNREARSPAGSNREARSPAVIDSSHGSEAPSFETVRVEIGEMDALLKGVAEAAVQLSALHQEIGTIEHALYLSTSLLEQLSPRRAAEPGVAAPPRVRSLAEELRGGLERLQRNLALGIERAERLLDQVRDAADRVRLLPASAVFSSLERAARDAAQSVGKRISFQTAGGETRLDAHVLGGIQDALLHVVRNAIAHGIETDRLAAGKQATGQVHLHVERRGGRVAFLCRDDGRGIDVDAVRRAALGRGLISQAQASSMSPQQIIRLILLGGVTTADTVTQVSGRGIGLDVVRETAARLHGEVSVQTETGLGTTIEVCVPVSFSSTAALVVEAAGIVAALPFDAVRRTLRARDGEIVRSAGGQSLLYEGQAIPFLPLARVLRQQPAPVQRAWLAVVIQSGTALAAVGVDRLLGTTSVVSRRLPSLALADPCVDAVALDARGEPQLVLSPRGLLDAVCAAAEDTADPPAPPRPPLLIVDDSLTTRMLEQSILQSAGYEVELATSAEEALAKARDRRYSLFVVDVEMPGMDGFEFVTRVQADAALRQIPAILVTSRGSAADQLRGAQAGARAYIIKGEFDQGSFLHTIRTLIG